MCAAWALVSRFNDLLELVAFVVVSIGFSMLAVRALASMTCLSWCCFSMSAGWALVPMICLSWFRLFLILVSVCLQFGLWCQ